MPWSKLAWPRRDLAGWAAMNPTDTLRALTQAVREADELFESGKTGGGGTRHWLRDCFLPHLEAHGLVIVPRETVEQARLSVHGVGVWLSESLGYTITEADLATILPSLERAENLLRASLGEANPAVPDRDRRLINPWLEDGP
jgi:hypothetical protein